VIARTGIDSSQSLVWKAPPLSVENPFLGADAVCDVDSLSVLSNRITVVIYCRNLQACPMIAIRN